MYALMLPEEGAVGGAVGVSVLPPVGEATVFGDWTLFETPARNVSDFPFVASYVPLRYGRRSAEMVLGGTPALETVTVVEPTAESAAPNARELQGIEPFIFVSWIPSAQLNCMFAPSALSTAHENVTESPEAAAESEEENTETDGGRGTLFPPIYRVRNCPCVAS
jgi:hypothetical protein